MTRMNGEVATATGKPFSSQWARKRRRGCNATGTGSSSWFPVAAQAVLDVTFSGWSNPCLGERRWSQSGSGRRYGTIRQDSACDVPSVAPTSSSARMAGGWQVRRPHRTDARGEVRIWEVASAELATEPLQCDWPCLRLTSAPTRDGLVAPARASPSRKAIRAMLESSTAVRGSSRRKLARRRGTVAGRRVQSQLHSGRHRK